jgi:hypothetical protein
MKIYKTDCLIQGEEMAIVKRYLNEHSMKHFIQSLMCMENGSTFSSTTIHDSIELKFSGDKNNVQKLIYQWLSVPERKATFEKLSVIGD